MANQLNTLGVINAFAEPTTAWFVLETGDFRLTPARYNPSPNDPIVSRAFLHALHEDLPDAILALIGWHFSVGANRSGEAFAYHDDVMTTMDVLLSKTVTLTDTDGNTRLLSKVKDIRPFTSLPQNLWLKATLVRINTHLVDNRPVQFAISHDTKDVAVRQDHLEESYPGALHRWQLGKDIGIEPAELMAHAFLNNPVAVDICKNLDVNVITFD